MAVSSVIYLKTDKLIHCASIIAEDFFTIGLPIDRFWQIFTTNDHGWLFFSVIDVIATKYLPAFLDIHPQVFAEKILSIFVFLILLGYCAALSENLTKYFKNKIFFSIGTLLIFPVVIYAVVKDNFIWVFYNTQWIYGYFLFSIFPLLLMKEFDLFYIAGQEFSAKKKYLIYFLIILTATSHEFFRIVFITALFIGYLLHTFLLKKINHKKFWKQYSIFTILNMLLFISPQMQETTQQRVNLDAFKNYDYLVNYSVQFLTDFKEYLLFANFNLFICLFIAWITVAFSIKDKLKKTRFYIYSFSLLTSAFIFILMMFFVNNYNNIQILTHGGLIFLFSSLLLSLICSSISFIIKYANNKIIKNAVKVSMILPLFLFFNNNVFMFPFNDILEAADKFRENTYILEKVYLLNRHKNDTIYMYNRNVNHDFDGAEIYLTKLYDTQIFDYEKSNERLQNICNDSDKWETCRKNMILKAKELGYTLTEKEIKNHNFAELYKSR